MEALQELIGKLVGRRQPPDPIAYVTRVVKPLAKKQLDENIKKCLDCEICDNTKSLTRGNCNASLLIIGEGVEEEQKGHKYVFPYSSSGRCQFLAQSLTSLKFNPDCLFWMNAVNCYAAKSSMAKRTPTSSELANCKIFIDYAIKMVEPLAILLLGQIPVKSCFPDHKLHEIRGSWQNLLGIPTLATYSPKYLEKMHKQQDSEIFSYLHQDFHNDLKTVIEYIKSKEIAIYNGGNKR